MYFKMCTHCQQELPVSEFYKRSGANTLSSWCKKCTLKASNNEFYSKAIARLTVNVPSERAVIEALRANGIPCYPGKSVSFAKVDIVERVK